MQTSNFSVFGMTCGSCVSAITTALDSHKNVESCQVSLKLNQAQVTYSCSASEIIQVIENCGFDAALLSIQEPGSPLVMNALMRTMADDDDAQTETFELMPLVSVNSAAKIQICTIKIVGMTCASCVNSIERHLNSTPGITSCSVALLAERADVTFDSSLISSLQICELVDEIGFEASLLTPINDPDSVTLMIAGMTCASCSSKIERKLSTLDGVLSVSINLLGQVGHFKFDKRIIGVRDIVENIESIGFNAVIATTGSNAQTESLARTTEIKMWRRSFFTSLFFSVPVSTISMILPSFIPKIIEYNIIPGLSIGNTAMLILTIPIQFRIGKKFHDAAYKAVKHGSATMDVLISLGTNIAFFFSCLAIIYSILDKTHPPPNVFFETSATLITFISFGRWLENRAKGKTSTALSKLISLTPTKATLLKTQQGNTIEKSIPAEYIQTGDTLKVFPGDRIPCDGIVSFGQTEVDESLLTGEPLPIRKSIDDNVIGGTVNGRGMILFKATKVGLDTTLAQIVKLVNEAQTSKAPIQELADKTAGYFVPTVIVLGVVTLVIWIILLSCMSEHMATWAFPGNIRPDPKNPVQTFFIALNFCISVIVVACPCALGLATPTAVMVGTGVGAKHGILIKGGASLEAGYRVNKIIFDKTGTLTVGKLDVVYHFLALDRLSNLNESFKMDDTLFFTLVGAAESGSEHSLGRAISLHAKKLLGIPSNQNFPLLINDFFVEPGSGIKCVVSRDSDSKLNIPLKTSVIIGNEVFLLENNVQLSRNFRERKNHHESLGHTCVLVALNNEFAGFIALADALKPEAIGTILALKSRGIQVAMVTGDQEANARVIAKKCGITEVYAGVSPAGKKRIVTEMQRKTDQRRHITRSTGETMMDNIKGGFIVAMVGDGINDSGSIAQSDLGIAVYGGTDVAIEAASIVLMRPELFDIITALDLSKAIFNRIRINFVWATVYNWIMIPLAMGFLSPFQYILSPMVGGMAMSLSSVSVVISSLLLKRYKKPDYSKFKNQVIREIDDEDDELAPIHVKIEIKTLLNPSVDSDKELFESPTRKRASRNSRSSSPGGIFKIGNAREATYAALEDEDDERAESFTRMSSTRNSRSLSPQGIFKNGGNARKAEYAALNEEED